MVRCQRPADPPHDDGGPALPPGLHAVAGVHAAAGGAPAARAGGSAAQRDGGAGQHDDIAGTGRRRRHADIAGRGRCPPQGARPPGDRLRRRQQHGARPGRHRAGRSGLRRALAGGGCACQCARPGPAAQDQRAVLRARTALHDGDRPRQAPALGGLAEAWRRPAPSRHARGHLGAAVALVVARRGNAVAPVQLPLSCPGGAAVAGRAGVRCRGRRPHAAALSGPGHVPGRARCGQPGLEAGGRAERPGAGPGR